MALKIRKDDMVKVIAGKSKGRTGRVLRVDPKNQRVYVEGANIIKRHQRPQTLRDTQRAGQVGGGVIEKEGPIHISNVMLLDPKSGDPTRVRIERKDGRRTRVAARSGEAID
jgi:large subunit ribosomal protein L24